jgi:hypothetical protein
VKWTRGFLVPSGITSVTSEDPNFPAARLINRVRPNRGWRSTSAAQQDIVVALAAAVDVAGVALHGANFASVQVGYGNAGAGPFTDFAGSPFAVNRDADTYRKLMIDEPVHAGFLRVRIPAQAADDGAGYFALGTIFVLGSLREFDEADAPGAPYQRSVGRPYFSAVVGGREELAPAGDFGSSHHWQRRTKGLAEWYELARGGEDAPILWFLDRGAREEVYYGRYRGGIQMEHGGVLTAVSLSLNQVT